MDDYKIIIEQEHQTVMAHYEVEQKPAEGYQSEARLEAALIQQLQAQGYDYVQVKDEAGLLRNLRRQLQLDCCDVRRRGHCRWYAVLLHCRHLVCDDGCCWCDCHWRSHAAEIFACGQHDESVHWHIGHDWCCS